MLSQFSRVFTTALFAAIFFTGCNKEGVPGSGSSGAIYDTTEKGTPVTVEKSKPLYFSPKKNDVFRYRVTVESVASAENDDKMFARFLPKGSIKSKTVYYLNQTVKSIRPDSTVDLSVRIDSILSTYEQDTVKLNFSTNREADKKDTRFLTQSILANQEVGVIVTRNGDPIEIYGTSNIVARLLSMLPDSLRSLQSQEQLNQNAKQSISEYVAKTLTHFPSNAIAKDSSWGDMKTQNVPVWQNVVYPMQIESRETLAGYEERNGKRLAVLRATSSTKPTITVTEQPPLKLSLNNWQQTTEVTSNVEDATGVLVYRSYQMKKMFDFGLMSSKQPDKTFRTVQTMTDRTVVELLR